LNLRKLVVISLIHGLLLTALSIYLQKLPWTIQGEDTLIQWSTIFKRIIWQKAVPEEESFLLVNTSYSNQLIDSFDENGFPLGNQVITDRFQLAGFLGALNRLDAHRWVLLDIFFVDSTDTDSLLRPEIEQLPRALLSTTTQKDGQKIAPIFNQSSALANVETLDDIFLKFRLIHNDSLKSIPLAMYEALHGGDYHKKSFLAHSDQHWALNYFIPDIRVSQYRLENEKVYPFVNLSDMLFLDDATIESLVKDRIVIVGDFLAHDNLETLTGQISGPLLLANVYLSLVYGDHLLTWPYLVFLFLLFSLISLLVFLPDDKLRHRLKFRNVIMGSSFILYLAIVSLLSYLFFNKALNVFLLSFYLIGLNYLLETIARKKKKALSQ
jgi:hypothetical protein